MEYYVYVTNNCNLNCSYCSVLFEVGRIGIPLKPNYLLEDLEKFITETQSKLKDEVADIYFFGGEPTMDFKMIDEIIRAMDKRHEYKVKYILHTNGLLVPNAPNTILEKLDLALISINYEKIYTNGLFNDYWGKILNSVMTMKSIKNIPLIGRLTISAKTSLYTDCSLLGNFFDYVYWQIDNIESVENFDAYSSNYYYEIDMLFKYWLSFLKEGVFLNYVPFVSAIGNYINKVPVPRKFYCGYGSSMIYIQTNGNCFACCDNVESKSHYIGDIYEGIQFPKIDLQDTVCNYCKYIKICGGRCGRMHKDFSKQRISQYCALNQYMFQMIEKELPTIIALIKKYPSYIGHINDPILSYTEFTA